MARAFFVLLCFVPLLATGQVFHAPVALGTDTRSLRVPAAGEQRSPRLAWLSGPSRLLAVWNEFRANPISGDIFAAVIDPLNPAAAVPFAVGPNNLHDYPPDLACGAQGCFAVWGSKGAYAEDTIWLQRFDLDGALLGPARALSPPANAARHRPSVAFLSDGSQALIAWEEGVEVFFLRLDAAGSVLQGPDRLSFTPGFANYRVRLAGTTSAWIALWSHEGASAWELRTASVSLAGVPSTVSTVPRSSSSPQVTSILSAGDRALAVSLELQGSYGHLLAWPFGDDGGLLADAGIPIGLGEARFGRPELHHDGLGWAVISGQQFAGDHLRADRLDDQLNGPTMLGSSAPEVRAEYAADEAISSFAPASTPTPWSVWMDSRGDIDADLYLGRVDLGTFTCAPAAGTLLFSSAPAQEQPALAASRDGFLAVWTEALAPLSRQLRLARLGRDGAPLAPPFTLADGGSHHKSPAIAADQEGFTVAWLDTFAASHEVHSARLGLDGLPTDGGRQGWWLFPVPYAYPSAPAVVATPRGTWMFTTAVGPGGVRHLFGSLFADGGWLDVGDTPRVVLGPEPGIESVAAAASRTQLYLVLTANNVRGTRLGFDGTSSGDLDAGLLISDSYAIQASVASDGTDFLVVWSQVSGSEEIAGSIVRGATGLPGPRLTLLAAAETDGLSWFGRTLNPKVVWDGRRYLVTADILSRDGGGDVVAVAVDADGGVLERIAVAASGDHEGVAAVASDGRGRVMFAWAGFDAPVAARRVQGRVNASIALGAACVSSAECTQGSCGTSGCCDLDGSGCTNPDGGKVVSPGNGPRVLRVGCGCSGGGFGAGGLALLVLLAARRVYRRAQ